MELDGDGDRYNVYDSQLTSLTVPADDSGLSIDLDVTPETVPVVQPAAPLPTD